MNRDMMLKLANDGKLTYVDTPEYTEITYAGQTIKVVTTEEQKINSTKARIVELKTPENFAIINMFADIIQMIDPNVIRSDAVSQAKQRFAQHLERYYSK